jgi:dipeptidyl-peptidase-4
VASFPLLDITTRTGSLKEIKYPMAGMDSEMIQIGVYNLTRCSGTYLKINDFGEDQYLTNVSWTPDGTKILVQVLDRSQKHMHLNMYDANTGAFLKTLLTEYNSKFVEPQDPVWFIKGSENLFIYRTDNRDGYRNLYLCDLNGNVRRLTSTDADVAYVANDGEYVWYTSAEVSPVENHLFRIKINVPSKAHVKGAESVKIGKPQQLTTEEGWHTIAMSPDCRHYIDSWSSLCVPRMTTLCTSDGTAIRTLLTADDPTEDYAYTEITLGTVKSADGRFDNYYRMIKPKDFDPSKKYPVIVYVYGGPHSQMVRNTYMAELRRWEMYMAQRGYLVYVQDNRGTQNRGADFEKAIHRQCGQAEMADQMEGVKMLMNLPYVDKDRIGVHGWSYGGFMTISLITNYPDIFKVGVAGGPVIDWKWYEVMYGERYMDHPDVNPEG